MGFAEFFADQRLAALYAYWSGKRGARPMPGRADIDPAELRLLLPHLLLIDVVDGGQDFRYRLVGTEIERQIGRQVTGRMIGEALSGDYLAYILSLHRRVLAERASVYAENSFNEGRAGFGLLADYKRTYRLMLPLSKDGTEIDMMLCGQVFQSNRARADEEILLIDSDVR
ncbi:MAG TPA: PAS domain-containing protein [Aliidongia sp.]|uniref:PAS domain-containing protein n=1 Tax=Aliidongia sp. TaxID=1914230 RepID=UPI002DDD45CC|nr:PAS domain-containing protein [Aliidongia sp.]HEV2673486.1 PAS domain-containing protein [Aliidongia sp.]